jgi:hypothetical protein
LHGLKRNSELNMQETREAGLMRTRRVLSSSVLTIVALAVVGSALAVLAKPSITSFKPASGKAGTKVTIRGKNLSGATSVKIGGLKASYKVSSGTKIIATVSGKARVGKLSVTTKGGTATSAKSFKVSVAATAPVVTPPVTSTYAPNGSGTLTASLTSATAGSTGNTITFTYTAATGGLSNGAILITVPTGWPAPVTTAAQGCTSGTTGVIATSGQVIDIFDLNLAAGATAVVTYGATSGGSFTGATCAPADAVTAPTTPGAYTFSTMEKSTDNTTSAGGVLTALSSSPTVTVS